MLSIVPCAICSNQPQAQPGNSVTFTPNPSGAGTVRASDLLAGGVTSVVAGAGFTALFPMFGDGTQFNLGLDSIGDYNGVFGPYLTQSDTQLTIDGNSPLSIPTGTYTLYYTNDSSVSYTSTGLTVVVS